MILKRRDAIKQMFVLAGGILIATSCDFGGKKATIALNNIDLSLDDEELIGYLVDGIIPKTDTPGAQDLRLHLFVMKMVDDCESPDNQHFFLEGLKAAHQASISNPNEAEAYLKSLVSNDPFLGLLKKRTLQGYLQSEYVMTEKIVYELIPGRYDGAVKIVG